MIISGRVIFVNRGANAIEPHRVTMQLFGLLAAPPDLVAAMCPDPGRYNMRYVMGVDGCICLTGDEPIIPMDDDTRGLRPDQLFVRRIWAP